MARPRAPQRGFQLSNAGLGSRAYGRFLFGAGRRLLGAGFGGLALHSFLICACRFLLRPRFGGLALRDFLPRLGLGPCGGRVGAFLVRLDIAAVPARVPLAFSSVVKVAWFIAAEAAPRSVPAPMGAVSADSVEA